MIVNSSSRPSSSWFALTVTVWAVSQSPVPKASVAGLKESSELSGVGVSVTVTGPEGWVLRLTLRAERHAFVATVIRDRVDVAGTTWIPGMSSSMTVTATVASTVSPW